MQFHCGPTLITILQGDITLQDAQAIVNAANSQLAGGGGVDGAIHRSGGPAIMAELDKVRAAQGGCPVGEAIITGAGNLRAKWVVHTVGPVYRGGASEPESLASCYRNSLRLAAEKGAKAIAFPSISTGVYRYPIEQAAVIAMNTVLEELEKYSFEEVRFILYSDKDYQVYADLMKDRL